MVHLPRLDRPINTRFINRSNAVHVQILDELVETRPHAVFGEEYRHQVTAERQHPPVLPIVTTFDIELLACETPTRHQFRGDPKCLSCGRVQVPLMYRPLPNRTGAVDNQAIKSLTAEFTVPQRVVTPREQPLAIIETLVSRYHPFIKLTRGGCGRVHSIGHDPVFRCNDLGRQGARRQKGVKMLINKPCDHGVIRKGLIDLVVIANGGDNIIEFSNGDDFTILRSYCGGARRGVVHRDE